MSLQQGDIILLPYPFTDQSGSKVRPAVIVSNDEYNSTSSDCLTVPMTSVLNDDPFSITIEQKDLCCGKLIKTSRVKADKVFAIEKSIIIKSIGKLSEGAFQRIRSKMLSVF